MTIAIEPLHTGGHAYYAQCRSCLFVSEPYGDETAARVLGTIHRCD
jgi:hypothetical protein